ncbi:TraR/DksA family transcriptional regulator [Idiomarina aminovorans]|jgi:DnaK suppressor protein|uniref:TraR/DksA family transcriptional regulator n=1 Tax=Idiomarina aminovorans TaxID=2914829 RepID=UPI0020068B4B|nr:TraR/DksA family transcriptional regulator [Idiomarina sp. ATCH4]MCK7459493.1 TraR/DksA family transcriptional regulator [Idiomarina sp. ATCH4]
MDANQIQTFKKQLEELKQQLLQSEEASKDDTKPVELDQQSIGRLSRMDAMQQQQMYQEQARRRKVQLQKVDGALRRIESEEFGECFVCGDDISLKRLQFDPTQTRCIECMESAD